MVRVIFDGVECEIDQTTRLMDGCDELRAPVSFSCRDGSCGTCAIAILEGAALLSPVAALERRTLRETKAPRGSRLACQARIRGGDGIVRIRAVEKA
jgi:ferredoxin